MFHGECCRRNIAGGLGYKSLSPAACLAAMEGSPTWCSGDDVGSRLLVSSLDGPEVAYTPVKMSASEQLYS